MDCGIPFCHNGCPLGNLIPEWNDLVWRDDWAAAIERLHATNNFPEFTGRLCPAPCETACVLGINQPAVTIKQVEVAIIDRAWADGWVAPQPPTRLHRQDGRGRRLRPGRAGRRPAADPRRPHGRRLRARRPDRRPAALRHPRVQDGEAAPRPPARADGGRGHRFRAGVDVGVDITGTELRGALRRRRARRRRDRRRATCPSRAASSRGIHQAMEYLPQANRGQRGRRRSTGQIDAAGKHVVIIGGGDTGADCLGTAHRQGAASVTQLEILPRPPRRAARRTSRGRPAR